MWWHFSPFICIYQTFYIEPVFLCQKKKKKEEEEKLLASQSLEWPSPAALPWHAPSILTLLVRSARGRLTFRKGVPNSHIILLSAFSHNTYLLKSYIITFASYCLLPISQKSSPEQWSLLYSQRYFKSLTIRDCHHNRYSIHFCWKNEGETGLFLLVVYLPFYKLRRCRATRHCTRRTSVSFQENQVPKTWQLRKLEAITEYVLDTWLAQLDLSSQTCAENHTSQNSWGFSRGLLFPEGLAVSHTRPSRSCVGCRVFAAGVSGFPVWGLPGQHPGRGPYPKLLSSKGSSGASRNPRGLGKVSGGGSEGFGRENRASEGCSAGARGTGPRGASGAFVGAGGRRTGDPRPCPPVPHQPSRNSAVWALPPHWPGTATLLLPPDL